MKKIFLISIVIGMLLSGCSGGSPTQPIKEPTLSEVLLTTDDLPGDFRQLTDEESSSMGLLKTEEELMSFFGGTPAESIIFMNESPDEFAFINCVVAHPVSENLITRFAAEMSNPDLFASDYISGISSYEKYKANYVDMFGDGSAGVSVEYGDSKYSDFIFFYRDDAVMQIFYYYFYVPKVNIQSLAQTLDDRVKAAYE